MEPINFISDVNGLIECRDPKIRDFRKNDTPQKKENFSKLLSTGNKTVVRAILTSELTDFKTRSPTTFLAPVKLKLTCLI